MVVSNLPYYENQPASQSGMEGKSAYEIAVDNGFVGTEEQWLASLQGIPGADSTIPGPKGDTGAASTVPGPKGDTGADSTVPGPKGDTGAVSTVPGPKGDKGDAGTPGTVLSSMALSVLAGRSQMLSGRYYDGARGNFASGTIALASTWLIAYPILITDPVTIDRIGVYVSTGIAGTNIRLGMYNVAADGTPSSLILDSGNLSTATTGSAAQATINQALSANTVYYLALLMNGSTATLSAHAPGSMGYWFGQMSIGTTGALFPNTVAARGNVASGPLPDPFGTNALSGSGWSAAVPRIFIRVV